MSDKQPTIAQWEKLRWLLKTEKEIEGVGGWSPIGSEKRTAKVMLVNGWIQPVPTPGFGVTYGLSVKGREIATQHE